MRLVASVLDPDLTTPRGLLAKNGVVTWGAAGLCRVLLLQQQQPVVIAACCAALYCTDPVDVRVMFLSNRHRRQLVCR